MSVAKKIKLNSFDSLFGTDSSSADITEIDISLLREFKDHPFKVIHDEKMDELIESIRDNGVLSPILVRKADNGYEIISGHRRRYACREIGIKTIPAVVKDYTDDEATVIMVDSNLQREEILPSEKAYSYKMKLDAMKRQGKRTDLDENDSKGMKSVDKLAEDVGESRANIRRYIRLTYLSKEIINGIYDGETYGATLLDLVDRKKLPLNAAVEISYLNENEQLNLVSAIEKTNIIPSLKQAIKLREYTKDKELTEDICLYILQEEKEAPKTVRLKQKKLEQYFPDTYTAEQMEDVILVLLEKWAKDKDLKKAEQWAKEDDIIN